VKPGGFYGWPWWYTGSHQDPRHAGKHPELAERAVVPDVLLQPHNASLQIAFYEGDSFPAAYRGDLFAAEHGSWNKSVRAGYEVIRIPLHQADQPSGDYEDFLTGFVLPSGEVWGRPVGVAVAPDGALLVTDDTSNSIWRVAYVGYMRGARCSSSGPLPPTSSGLSISDSSLAASSAADSSAAADASAAGCTCVCGLSGTVSARAGSPGR
jgi:hypothetical protein